MRWLLPLCLLLPGYGLASTQVIAGDASLKAAFIYRFAQFTVWPDVKPDRLRYCVAGDDKVLLAMRDILRDSSNPVTAVTLQQNLQSCDVLYIAAGTTTLSTFFENVGTKTILTIAENVQTFRQGMVIGFITEPKRLSFRVNLQVAKQQGLTLSSQMLKLAKEIY